MLRRTFLQTVSSAGAAFSACQAKAQRRAGDGIRLGFDSYTLRAFEWKDVQFLDYAAQQRLDTVQLSDLLDFASIDPVHLRKVKDHAERLGITIDGGLGCICPTAVGYHHEEGDPAQYILRGLRACQAVGATCMRCFMGDATERRGTVPLEQHVEMTVKILRSVRSRALDFGVRIAVENHGDLQAWEMRNLIEEAGKDFVGSCLDTGNPITVIEDPLISLEKLAPYVITTHVRDSVVFEHPRGAVTQWVALGDGSLDYVRFFERFRQLCPYAAVQLEILTGGLPRVVPYLEPDFWAAYPKAKASEFARFVALAREGHPFMGSMLIAGPGQPRAEYQTALKEQKRIDLERSFEYARNVLGLGIRGRG